MTFLLGGEDGWTAEQWQEKAGIDVAAFAVATEKSSSFFWPVTELNEPKFSLVDLVEHDAPVAWIVTKIVKPLTDAEQSSLAALLAGYYLYTIDSDGNAGDRHIPLVGLASDFHSYTWQSGFRATIDVLWSHIKLEARVTDNNPHDHFVWIDMLSQNQHAVSNVEAVSSVMASVERCLCSIPAPWLPVADGADMVRL